MLTLFPGSRSQTAWASPVESQTPKITLDISVLTRPPSEAISKISSASASLNRNQLSTTTATATARAELTLSEKRLRIKKKKKKKVRWNSIPLGLAKSFDSAVIQSQDYDDQQLFLFSSQPRVVLTAGPVSPHYKPEEDSQSEYSDIETIPADWGEEEEQQQQQKQQQQLKKQNSPKQSATAIATIKGNGRKYLKTEPVDADDGDPGEESEKEEQQQSESEVEGKEAAIPATVAAATAATTVATAAVPAAAAAGVVTTATVQAAVPKPSLSPKSKSDIGAAVRTAAGNSTTSTTNTTDNKENSKRGQKSVTVSQSIIAQTEGMHGDLGEIRRVCPSQWLDMITDIPVVERFPTTVDLEDDLLSSDHPIPFPSVLDEDYDFELENKVTQSRQD